MDEDRFNQSLRKFLKQVGVTSQREIERIVRERGLQKGPLRVKMVLTAAGTDLNHVVEGDIDLRGILGLSPDVRNGYDGIRVRFEIEGDAPPEKLRQIVEQSVARSAVYDVLTHGVPVEVSVNAG